MKKKEVTIKDLAEILLPKLWIVVIVSLIASGIAFVYSSFFKTETYTSSSRLLVNSTTVGGGTSITTGDNVIVARYMLENYKIILKSDKFLNMVVMDLSNSELYKDYRDITANINANQINSMMTISHYEDTEIFSISITSSDPKLSSVLLKAIHINAVENIGKIVPSAKVFTLSSLQDPIEPEAYRSILKNSNNAVRNTVLVFMIFAVLSVLAIWIFSFFDVIIRDKKKLYDNIDVPVLGVIPKHELLPLAKGDNADV